MITQFSNAVIYTPESYQPVSPQAMGCQQSFPVVNKSIMVAIEAMIDMGGGQQAIHTQSLNTRFIGSVSVARMAIPVAPGTNEVKPASNKSLIMCVMEMLQPEIEKVMADESSEGMNSATIAGGYNIQVRLERVKANAAERQRYKTAMAQERSRERQDEKDEKNDIAGVHQVELELRTRQGMEAELSGTTKKRILLEEEVRRLTALRDVRTTERDIALDVRMGQYHEKIKAAAAHAAQVRVARDELDLDKRRVDMELYQARKKRELAAEEEKDHDDRIAKGNLVQHMNTPQCIAGNHVLGARYPIYIECGLIRNPGQLEVVFGHGIRLLRFYNLLETEVPVQQLAFKSIELGSHRVSNLTSRSSVTLSRGSTGGSEHLVTIHFPHEFTTQIVSAVTNPFSSISSVMTHEEILAFWRKTGEFSELEVEDSDDDLPALDDGSDSDDDLPALDDGSDSDDMPDLDDNNTSHPSMLGQLSAY